MNNNGTQPKVLLAAAHGAMLEALAETALSISDVEIIQEVKDGGEDPAKLAGETRGLLLRVAKDFRQRHLRAAAVEYRRRVSEMGTRWVDLPETPEGRRALLSSVFARNPGMQSAYVTVQHREFKEMSDNDIESCLVQLAELGLFEDEEP